MRITPLIEIICRFLIVISLMKTVTIITVILLGERFDILFWMGFMIMLSVWVALPSQDLFNKSVGRPESFRTRGFRKM